MRTLLVVTAILIGSLSASDVGAGDINELHGLEKSVGNVLIPQMLSVLNRGRNWTPTEFAIARGDTRGLTKTRAVKDMIIKSGIAPRPLLKILPWIKDRH